MARYVLGYDIGSSSVKAAIVDAESGKAIATAYSPETELEIIALHPGWAEQHPETWWKHVKLATARLIAATRIDAKSIVAIGISYQMHGLVVVDKQQNPLRPSIIWCDSRAVEIGNHAFKELGNDRCLSRLLNSPGNFTASKLKWVKDNEPDIYRRIHAFMLPGDYIAMKLTGRPTTTPSGLSEGILWDYRDQAPSSLILDHYGIDHALIPEIVQTFSVQGEVTAAAASELGLTPGTPVSYRAGDQPNNALSLNVLEPGEIAATAGTSGVVYGVTDQANYDPQSRVNTFVHVSHTQTAPRYGILLCINGTGILNSWLKHQIMGSDPSEADYIHMNKLASEAPIGSGGLVMIPYGNGAERSLGNKNIGASVHNLSLTTHNRSHLLRAAQEGIVFALAYGIEIIRGMGVSITRVRAGQANMFLSPLFREAFASTTGAVVELFNTDGAQGAARGAGLGAGIFKDRTSAFAGLALCDSIQPDDTKHDAYLSAYSRWRAVLNSEL
jgi:xylulokinase